MLPVLLALLVLLLAAPPAAATTELPRGGTTLLGAWRLAGLYGHPDDARLGALGRAGTARAGARAAALGRGLRGGGLPVLPALQLIVSTAQRTGGPGGLFRRRASHATVRRWLDAARAARALLVLEVQGGRSDFLAEARAFAPFLREPDVGLGLDPEWRVRRGQVPGRHLGSVSGREVRRVARYLDAVVRRHDLPQKLLVVHRFTERVVRDERDLPRRPGVALVVGVDAIGTPAAKRATYRRLARRLPGVAHGLMLFERQDRGRMTPRQVLGLRPSPALVSLQ